MGDQPNSTDWLLEQQEWMEALDEVLEAYGRDRAEELFQRMKNTLAQRGVNTGGQINNSPYLNTISADDQPKYPGDLELEAKLEGILKWNAQAMVLQAYDKHLELGGHIATYAATSTMLEVLYNHFLRNPSESYGGDILMIQGHGSPGIYARAVLEGRLSVQAIKDFRQETLGGVASYPHPRRMPQFWQAPSVSMGLGSMTAIYQARFMKYLEARGLKKAPGGRIWCYIGDGEFDEPEVVGTLALAGREGLDNLCFILNANLQRLDGPVRGNGKIIQEAERLFAGANWNIIKVIWASEWDAIFERDVDGVLLARFESMVDGDFQEISNLPGAKIREKIAQGNTVILDLLAGLTDDQLQDMRRGGHDPIKIFAAYHEATRTTGRPTVIIMKTVKGYGMGKAAEGKNGAHQTKNLMPDSRLETRTTYGVPLSDDQAKAAEFYLPKADDKVMEYLQARRKELGGYLPERRSKYEAFAVPDLAFFQGQLDGSKAKGDKAFSTTAAMVDIMTQLARNEAIGKYIVPIVPDEAQTFGMEPMFNSVQIYNPLGQQYTPLEIKISVIKYKESKTGQVLQEGINEAGATSSFTAVGSAYATYGLPMVPFYIYYSMFGFQRVGDSIWAAADMMCKGFLLGATAGRTTLNGEGLQHEDGHSHLIALTNPGVEAWDPAFAYEAAVIVQDGLRRMYVNDEAVIFYMTIYNENYVMPSMPKGAEAGILRGMYKWQATAMKPKTGKKAHVLASGGIMQQAIEAAQLLESEGIATDIWSVTSWNNLYRDAEASLRHNLLNPGEKARTAIVQDALKDEEGVFVAVSDWVKLTPGALGKWMPEDFIALGTDGFGLSDSRPALRDYFEISPKFIAFASLRLLQKQGKVTEVEVKAFAKKHNIKGDKFDPMSV
jgi:pyruvate dehydrogenase E1 component